MEVNDVSERRTIGVVSESTERTPESKCPRCGLANPLRGDGIEYNCALPACTAVVKSQLVEMDEGGGRKWNTVWDWSPKAMDCTHCGRELLVTVQEFAVIKYVCINPDCVHYEE